MIISKTFASGLRLVAKHMPDMYTVSVGVYVDVGSVREQKENNGYSHFIEHLMFKGTTNRTFAEISECMDDIGAQLNAFTSKDNTCYYTKSASQDIAKCLDLLSDMYFNSTFDADEIEKEKCVVLEEISANDDNPEDVAQDLICESIYGNQCLGQTILGTPQNIKDSTRDSLMAYKAKYYTPANTVIAIAGNFDMDNIVLLIEQYFETDFNSNYPAVAQEPTALPTAQHLYRFMKVEQSQLAFVFDGLPYEHADTPTRQLVADILGGGLSSRLFQILREQNGLAYSVYSYTSAYKNNGFFEICCGTNPNNIPKLCTLLSELLRDFVKNGATVKELQRAKVKYRNAIYMAMENSLSVMRAFGRRMIKTNSLSNFEQQIEEVDNLTLQHINEEIVKIFAQPYSSVYVGPETDNYLLLQNMRIN